MTHQKNTTTHRVLRQILSAMLVMGACANVLTLGVARAADAPTTSATPASQSASAALAYTIFLPILSTNHSDAEQGERSAPAATQIYWGAIVDGQAPSSQHLTDGGVFPEFEAMAGKGMSILHWGQPWEIQGAMAPFQTEYFNSTRQRGSIPLLDWGSWAMGGGPTQPKYRLSTITDGNHDAYIRQWAQDAKAWGHPFFLRFNWEMNGTWQFPWAEQINGNQPGDFVRAWRHVHDIFTEVGAENATWVWCPNVSGGTTRPYAQLYPGGDYVDWTCLDGYNFYSTWLSPQAVFAGSGINWLYNSYEELLTVAPDKPIMIGETSSNEAGDGGAKKAAWISEFLSETLPNEMPAIKALVWFNWDANSPSHASLPIESSPASIAAFAHAIGSDYYAPNVYGSISVSPIPPP